MKTTLTHLEVHSRYSLLGSTSTINDLIQQAQADGLTNLALTDTDALYGAIEFSRACQAVNIRPIIGMTVRVAWEAGMPETERAAVGKLVLLATGPTGYRSLSRLASFIQGRPQRELIAQGITWEALKAQREGLICLSGGRFGWTERLLRAGQPVAAYHYAARLAGIFGDNAYLALELHQQRDQAVAREVAAIGRRLGLPTVAVQPVYTLQPGDLARLTLLAAINRNCALTDLPPTALPNEGDDAVALHWLAPTDMAERFAPFREALPAIDTIVQGCEPALPDGRPIWPVLPLPPDQSPDQALAAAAQAGLSERYGPEPASTSQDRLTQELTAIAERGYAPLFLVVADIVRFARSTQVPVSTRGSVANSLVAYCTGITTVDPIEHELLFERFLNPARADVPDIDLDLCSRRRDRVLEYVRRIYGQDRVALVGAMNTMRPRSAVRGVGKAYGLNADQMRRLIDLFPNRWHPDPRRREERSLEAMLADLNEPRLTDALIQAYHLVGQPDHLSLHAGAVVITPGPLTDIAPVQWTPKGFLATQFDHGDVEALGLVKIDLLGISALTVIADAGELVQAQDTPGFQPTAIPTDDEATATLLMAGETIGVFQFESEGAQQTLRKLKARTIHDLAVANAFFKPGPATGGMAGHFVRRYRGEEKVNYLHPALKPILASTQGIILFQEQILRIAHEIADLSWAEANRLRRGMSKFQAKEMEAIREAFIRGCCRPAPTGPDFTQAQAETLWDQVIAFAGYGFNQGHATAYAEVSYQTAYLKAHYPAAFFTARLATGGGFHHQPIYIAEARRLGLTVRPPHINHSLTHFTRNADQPDTLWMGLGQVRDVRQTAVEAIIAGRRARSYDSLRDLLGRAALQPKEVAHLIRCGALDGLAESRAALLADLAEIDRAGSTQQMALPLGLETKVRAETAAQRLVWERELLGLPVSLHPLEITTQRPADCLPLAELSANVGRPISTLAFRLPGYTGGSSYFISDGQALVVARSADRLPRPEAWQPVRLEGRYRQDRFGMAWFQIQQITRLPQTK